MRLGIFGGSFDPPHVGHQALLRAAVRRLRPDKTIVVPAWRAPLKGVPSAPASDRALAGQDRLQSRIGMLPALVHRFAPVMRGGPPAPASDGKATY